MTILQPKKSAYLTDSFIKQKIFTIISVSIVVSFLLPAFSQAKETYKSAKKINRRVLILDFYNVNQNENYAYLSNSIADAFQDPLDKTKIFELLKRSLWSQMLTKGKFVKRDAYNEDRAVAAGKAVQADVVLTGSFSVVKDFIKMTAKAIEVSSGRVMVNRSRTSRLTGNIFNAIDLLAKDMAARMKNKLPPLEQRIIIKETPVTYSGIIWRSAIIPGWGHYYAKSWRSYLYFGLWLGSASAFGYFVYDTADKKSIYEKADSGLQEKYDAYNEASKNRAVFSYVFAGVYVLAIADAILFGKKYVTKEKESAYREDLPKSGWQFAMQPEPSFQQRRAQLRYRLCYHYFF